MAKRGIKNELLNNFLYCLIVIILLNSSCNNSSIPENNAEKKTEVNPPVKKKPSSTFQDTLVISVSAAVFYYPDSIQLERIGALYEKGEFESMKHECFYQKRNARKVLEQYWHKVKLIETSRVRYLMFVNDDHSRTLVDLDTKNMMCGVILFTQGREPMVADMMNIETDAGFYFKN